jgi:hypothetical protein
MKTKQKLGAVERREALGAAHLQAVNVLDANGLT